MRMIEGDNVRSVGVGKGGSAPPLPVKFQPVQALSAVGCQVLLGGVSNMPQWKVVRQAAVDRAGWIAKGRRPKPTPHSLVA